MKSLLLFKSAAIPHRQQGKTYFRNGILGGPTAHIH